MFCKPRSFSARLSVPEFLNLTFPQLLNLIQELCIKDEDEDNETKLAKGMSVTKDTMKQMQKQYRKEQGLE